MSKECKFNLPVSEEEIRNLRCGDIVYLSGIVYTMRDMGHRRAVEILQKGGTLPFDLNEGVIWHCGPIVNQQPSNKWEVLSAGSTTSSRFTDLGASLTRSLNIRCTIGKGTMMANAAKAMNEVGSCFLNSTGGCAALYATQIEEVVDVFWTDLGLPEATWVFKVNNLGPLVVGIDSHSNSLYNTIRKTMETNLTDIYKRTKILPDHTYSYLPKRVPGSAHHCDD